jgi:hypothetical protein
MYRTQVAPSFYQTTKGGQEVQTAVSILAIAFCSTKLLALVIILDSATLQLMQ